MVALPTLPLLICNDTWKVWLIPGAFLAVGILAWRRSTQVSPQEPVTTASHSDR